ncbi:MAG: aminotransferase class V-fold PLP-dependent enzyme [Bryobacteraceae bacterium]|nr:aminotransferase class V-fold PLP-dependent enzyme [Bryobacteraceae bacterium]
MDWTRRNWMSAAVTTAISALGTQIPLTAAQDEAAWQSIQEGFPVDRSIINLNHAGIGTSPRSVVEAVIRRTWNEEKCTPNTIFSYGPQLEPVRRDLAKMLGSDPEEIAVTRNATESLQTVLMGVPLKTGDEVLTTTLDYWAMLDALDQRKERDGIVVKKIKVPVPCSDLAGITQAFDRAITPRTKLILVSHPINLNGQLFPVGDISRLAHAKGIEVVVDAAQSFALTDCKISELGCDYLGTSLHKWLQAPKGTGMLYVKREKIGKLWPLFPSGVTKKKEDIRKFELYGTWPETILAIGDSIAFHNAIGAERKEARLRFLTQYWVDAIKATAGIRFHTAFGQKLSCGISCVEVEGVPAGTLRNWLLEKRRILTMDITRRTKEFSGVRVSPGLSTTLKELDALSQALRDARSQASV